MSKESYDIMRICLDLRYKTESGASSYIRNLVPELLKYDRENSYLIIKYPTQSFDFEKSLSQVILSPMKNNLVQILWDIFVLPVVVCKARVNIYHPLKNPGPFWIRAKKVYTMHSITHDYKGSFPTSWKRFLYDMIYTNNFIKSCDRLIAISHFISDFLTDSFNIKCRNIDIIYHGISDKFRRLSQEHIDFVIHKYSLPKRYILSVGNITPVKNHMTVIKAFSEIYHKISVGLVIVGGHDNPYFKDVSREINEKNLADRVLTPGFIDGEDLIAIISGSEAMIIPSLTEGFGFVMLEAFKCGLPVIASKRGGLWDLGKGCALFVEDPYDYIGFSKQIMRLLSSQELQERLSRLSKLKASRHTWEEAAKAHLRTYQTLYEQLKS